MSSGAEQEEESKLHSSAKINMVLLPLNERTREGLKKDGHNPFLKLTLRPRKKISSVLERLNSKWGSSSIAIGELMLFPYNVVSGNMTTCKRWTSSEAGITAADVHAAIGRPDNFRLRYGWVSTQMNGSTSSPSVGDLEPRDFDAEAQTEVKSRQVEPDPVARQTTIENEEPKPKKARKVEQDGAIEGRTSAGSFKDQEPRLQNDWTYTSLLWSDASNISIGGLLSEASLQGRFHTRDIKLGGDKSEVQTTTVISDSLDALIYQFKCPQASSDLASNLLSSILGPENAPRASESYGTSSILDAENTCHSFAFPKPSSGKDFLSLGRSALSELSNKEVGSGPFKCLESGANAQNGVPVSSAMHEPKTDSLPSSGGVFNNDNSLGLSSIRWNDSLGPFDLPLAPRQVVKDDSISIGGFVR